MAGTKPALSCDGELERGLWPGPKLKAETLRLLSERGVTVGDIAEIVKVVQQPYYPDLTMEEALASVNAVVDKREVQHAVLTGIALDVLAEENLLPEPLNAILVCDDPLYGVDEVLALSVTNIYGTIGLTTFGYLDKEKLLVIGRLNDAKNRTGGNQVHTFLDDIVAAIAAAGAARIAHQRRD